MTLDLSIIIPVLNERELILSLLENLSKQEEVNFEVIFSDGGSVDGTVSFIKEKTSSFSFPIKIVECGKGRGRQMNNGVFLSYGKTLLFLHADSYFSSGKALRRALIALNKANKLYDGKIAGRFSLNFSHESSFPSKAYIFYESKARLNRKDCIHGDQGFLIPASFFEELGKFEESFLEDDHFVEQVNKKGGWILIDEDIYTSSRRFETEGFLKRQVLNALIKNSDNIGWKTFFHEIPFIYFSQDKNKKLKLYPIFKKIRWLIKSQQIKWQYEFWYSTGIYVSTHVWQVFFAVDVWNSIRKKQFVSFSSLKFLNFFDRYIASIMNSLLCRLITTLFVWCWFNLTCFWLKVRENK